MKLKTRCPLDRTVMALSAKCMRCGCMNIIDEPENMVFASCIIREGSHTSRCMFLGIHKRSDLLLSENNGEK